MPSRFVAPKRLDTLEDVRKALQLVQEQFDANGISRARGQLVTTSTTLAAGEFVRLSPRQGATLIAKLPKATAENTGLRIQISIERPNGIVKIAAEKPDTVSGLSTASFTLAGLIVLVSNGTDQWVLSNQLPTNSPAAATNYFFSNANGVTFGTVGSTVTASVAAGGGGGIAASANGSSQSAGTVVWSNSNNVTFGMNGSTITASVTVASTQASIRLSAGTTSVLSSGFTFSNSNNVSFGMNAAGVFTASVTVASTQGSIRISAGTTNVLGSAFSLSNANGLAFGLNGSTITGSYSQSTRDFVVAHVGGNSVSNVTRLNFSNASNVTFSLSTVAGAATLFASVATAGGGGGIAVADIYGNTVTNGTVLFSQNNNNSTLSNLWSNGTRSGNVAFGLVGSTMTAQAHINLADVTNGNGEVATRLNFVSSNGINLGLATVLDSNGDRVHNLTASAVNAIQRVIAGTGDFSNNTFLSFADSNGITWGNSDVGFVNVITASVRPPPTISVQGVGVSATAVTDFNINATGNIRLLATTAANALSLNISVDDRDYAAAWVPVIPMPMTTAAFGAGLLHNRPFFFQLPPNDIQATQIPVFTDASSYGPGEWLMLVSGQNTATTGVFGSSHPITIRLGLYEVNNSTQLTLINSVSFANTATSNGASAVSMYGGRRWIRFARSAWSNSTLSVREGQWMGVHISTGASFETHINFLGAVRLGAAALDRGGAAFFGAAGVSSVNTRALHPYEGYYSTTSGALPGSVGSTNDAQFSGATGSNNFFPFMARMGNVRVGHIA